MCKRIISVFILVAVLFALGACKQKEESVAEPSEFAPIAQEEPEEVPVKEFSDGRLYTEGDIISFAETENYYFTVDNGQNGAFISCYTKEGNLLKREKLETEPYYDPKTTGVFEEKKFAISPDTDIYPVKGDSVVFCSLTQAAKFVMVNHELDIVTRAGMDYPDLRYNRAAFIENSEGYMDIVSLDMGSAYYRFDSSKKICIAENIDIPENPEYTVSHTGGLSVIDAEDGYYMYAYQESMSSQYNHLPMLVKFSNDNTVENKIFFHTEYDSIFDAQSVGNYIAFANADIDESTGNYINRLYVLDKNLNLLYTKDYVGECPVEVVPVGDNIAVSVYKNGGGKSSYIEILDSYGNTVETMPHALMYARLLSDKNGGFYVTGKQGEGFESNVNTLVRRYNENLELISETLFETENDYDKGWGLYFEVSNSGEFVALQGNIEDFPLYTDDKSSYNSAFEDFQTRYSEQKCLPFATPLAAKAEENRLLFSGQYDNHLIANNKFFVVSHTLPETDYVLSAFNTSGERLWSMSPHTYSGGPYYMNGMVIVDGGGIVYGFNAESGENLWLCYLDERGFYMDSVLVDDKVCILFQYNSPYTGEITYGICAVDSEGNTEYKVIPESGLGEPIHDSLICENGKLYCTYRNENGISVACLNSDFEVESSYTIENERSVDYTVSESGIYISVNSYDEEKKDFNGKIIALNENMELIFEAQTGTHTRVLKGLSNNRVAVYTDTVVLYDGNGKILKELAMAGSPSYVLETGNGLAVVCEVSETLFKIYRYNSEYKLTGVEILEGHDFTPMAFSHNGKIITG